MAEFDVRIVELAFGSVKVLNDVVGPVNCVKAFPSENVRIVAALNTLTVSYTHLTLPTSDLV